MKTADKNFKSVTISHVQYLKKNIVTMREQIEISAPKRQTIVILQLKTTILENNNSLNYLITRLEMAE